MIVSNKQHRCLDDISASDFSVRVLSAVWAEYLAATTSSDRTPHCTLLLSNSDFLKWFQITLVDIVFFKTTTHDTIQ